MDNAKFDFWCKCLSAFAIFCMIFGLSVALLINTPLFVLWNGPAMNLFFDGLTPEDLPRYRQFLGGIIGGAILAWAVLQFYIIKYPFRNREKWAWNATGVAVVLWFSLDSAVCAYLGAWFNILLFNVPTILAIGIPLLATRKEFIA